ncbi:MAG: MFS transporter [Eubacterium sp.]|nr:MFS transporter [Eubacterium sp.]
MKTTHWKRSFFTIACGQTVSLVGSSAVQFAMIWWLATQTASPMVMSLSGLAALLPQAILGPFAGVWVDRLKRKGVVIGADMFMGLAALVLAAVFFFKEPPYWSVFIVLALRSLGTVFHTPAIQSIIPTLVPQEALVKVNGWSQFMQSGAFMLGPVVGAAMYGFLPMSVILLTDFVGAAVASLTVLAVKIPDLRQRTGEKPHFWREMKEGIAVCIADRTLARLLAVAGVSMVFFMPLSTLYPLMTSDFFQGTVFQASVVELLYAMGMMAASFVLGIFGSVRHQIAGAYLGLLLTGVMSLFSGLLSPSTGGFWLFVLFCGFMGAGGNIYNIMSVAYMQAQVPQAAQGRVFALVSSMLSLTMPLGLLISGPVAEAYGVPMWFLVSGIGVIAAVLWGMLQEGKRRRDYEN